MHIIYHIYMYIDIMYPPPYSIYTELAVPREL